MKINFTTNAKQSRKRKTSKLLNDDKRTQSKKVQKNISYYT